MCGIAGYIGKKCIEGNKINDTLSSMKRRGPDHNNYSSIKYHDTNIYLLHSRLSILDLDQRFQTSYTIGDYTVVFNGEIYNFVEVREQMKSKDIVLLLNQIQKFF